MAPLLVGTRKGLFTIAESGAVIRHDFAGVPVSAVLHDPPDGALYAGLDHGHFGVKLHRSDDAGVSWIELPAPAFPAGLDGAPAVSLIWVLEAGRPGEIWAGTIPGGLFRSDDRGQSWQLVDSLWQQEARAEWMGGGFDQPGIHSISVDPRDRARMTIGVSCGGVWLSEDGGTSWRLGGDGLVAGYMPDQRRDDRRIQDPHRLARCQAAPDRVWTQHHSGVFRSDDGGESWQRITGLPRSDFGFAVAAHPHDPDTAWFVPAESDQNRIPVGGVVTVSRTRDGGRSFDSFSAGLPPPPAYDLVYRHAFDVAPDGAALAMGSTTGGLWLSADAGESWRIAAARLPPIACLRIVT
ncbi:MAG TPA: exo-alpha-sialidase [Aliidongia sp.]|nr:exo-alpha-sialidase [Aliidongia sp.]